MLAVVCLKVYMPQQKLSLSILSTSIIYFIYYATNAAQKYTRLQLQRVKTETEVSQTSHINVHSILLAERFSCIAMFGYIVWNMALCLDSMFSQFDNEIRRGPLDWGLKLNNSHRLHCYESFTGSTFRRASSSELPCWDHLSVSDLPTRQRYLLITEPPCASCSGSQSLEFTTWSCQGRNFTARFPSRT